MFKKLTLHGTRAALMTGHREAVVLRDWRITRGDEGSGWKLAASLSRVDAFLARKSGLLFAAPRPGGFWTFPVRDLQLGTDRLVATLEPPEQ